MNIRYLAFLPLSLIVGCSSEYGPSDLEVSDKGAFVEKGSSSLIDGEVVIEREQGGSLVVEFDDGFPDGDVVMRNSDNDIVLESSFVPKADIGSVGGGGFINEMLTRGAGQLSTRDYLQLFEEFSEYDGDFLEVDGKRKTQGHYSHGKKDENWKTFCENGKLASDVTYQEFDEDDKKVIKKIGEELVYNCNGDVLLSAKRDKKGRLQGEYFEAARQGYGRRSDDAEKPQPKYERNYKDGELNGIQKEYHHTGAVRVENSYKAGVKDGVEKTYNSKYSIAKKEQVFGIHEHKTYAHGQLNGLFSRYDANEKIVLSGQYRNDKPAGLWTNVDPASATKFTTDYEASNFIIDKAKAFKKACFLPGLTNSVRWSSSSSKYDLSDCKYYAENKVVDINKKLAFDLYSDFSKSSKWSYVSVVAPPAVYDYLKTQGLETNVVDSQGRSRLNMCIELYRPRSNGSSVCTIDQAISYVNDVNLNAVSNAGTALHQLGSKRGYGATKARHIEADLKLAKAIIEAGANVNQLNYRNESALMIALANSEYALAEILLNAGASIDVKDGLGRTTIGRVFIDGRGRLKSKKIGAEGVRVLAKIIALGGDTSLPIKGDKTVVDLSEESNTLHHIQTIKEAKSMSVEFSGDWKAESQKQQQPVTQSIEVPQASDNTKVSEVLKRAASVKEVESPVVPSNAFDAAPASESVSEQVTSAGVAPVEDPLKQPEPVAALESNESRAAALLREQADFLVEQANDHIKSSRLKTPKNNSALSSLEQLRRIDPENENIPVIEDAIGNKYLRLASGKINKGDKRGAQSYLNSAGEFLNDKAPINDMQQRINSYVAPAPVASVSSSQRTTSTTSSSRLPALACEPSARAAGVPVLGRTFTVKQSYPRAQSTILSTAARVIRRTYSNVQQSSGKITYQQPTKGKPIKFTLTVEVDGNNTQMMIKAKTPAGLVTTKAAYKKAFCEIVAEL